MKNFIMRILRKTLALQQIVLMGAVAVCLTGCDTTKGQAVGGLLGGVGGGALGSQIFHGKNKGALVIASTLAGAMLGMAIGGELDPRDKKAMEGAVITSLERGEDVQWKSDTGNYGTITTTTTTTTTVYNHRPCRKFKHLAYIDGKPVEVRGIACQDALGKWSIQAP